MQSIIWSGYATLPPWANICQKLFSKQLPWIWRILFDAAQSAQENSLRKIRKPDRKITYICWCSLIKIIIIFWRERYVMLKEVSWVAPTVSKFWAPAIATPDSSKQYARCPLVSSCCQWRMCLSSNYNKSLDLLKWIVNSDSAWFACSKHTWNICVVCMLAA